MLTSFHYLLTFVIIVSLLGSLFFSIRYRMQKQPAARGLNAARMNISMGILLIAIALSQLLLFSMNWVRLIVGTLFVLIGLFNLFAGLRNHTYYSRNQP